MNDNYIQKLRASKIKENNIVKILNKNGYMSKLFVVLGDDGRETYQSKNYNGEWKSYPDIETFSDDEKEIVLLIEVKGFFDFPDDLPFKTNEKVLAIKESQFLHYSFVQGREEIPIKIVFVIGNDAYEDYDYFWDTLEEMINKKKIVRYWNKKGFNCNTIFFRAKDFRSDIKNLGKL